MRAISTSPSPEAASPSRLRAWLQLVRLPNVFTAAADVLMGYLVVNRSFDLPEVVLALVASSVALYGAGMVLNDVFDAEVDARERPQRPIPSGRIALSTARWAGAELLLVGVALGCVAGSLVASWRPALVAALLAGTVLLYDGWLKRTPLGALGMGACRLLNVLLGMSAAEGPWLAPYGLIAGGIGAYIAGVTLFARSEAEVSNRGRLALGAAVMAAGLVLLALLPEAAGRAGLALDPRCDVDRWRLLLLVVGLLIGGRVAVAVWQPTPAHVQLAVKNAILSLIVLDAVVASAFAGLEATLVILVLLLLAMFLGRWIYST
jgi:4-hydroxybenzoate polyprenyltransferase